MATTNTILSFKIAPNPSPVSSFKEKTMTMNPSLSWDSAKTKLLLLPLWASTSKKPSFMSVGYPFRTTEESLRNAFQNFGQLVDVNLLMDKVAKRPRGFAFLRYKTEEEAQKAIEGMHGKIIIFVIY
ncbi:hypothetical protein OIU78_017201 [Salix suchowensis]|nr:hypothetical protein OIU78_017201 [Salix suchowensis]